MKTLLLAAVATAALAVPALAQNQAPAAQQTQPMKQPAQQTQPMTQGTQAQANMQEINPSMLDHQQVQKIQQALDKSGFSAGRTDGIWGPETKAALMKLQKSKNMESPNGQLDSSTLSALQLNPDQFGMSAASSGGMNNTKAGANAANGAMKGAPGQNNASTGSSTGAANTPANAANGGMKSANTNNTTGAKPDTAKTTP